MPDPRKIIFANGEIYHIFNRGIDRRPTFTTKREYAHALETLRYYQFANHPIKFSHFMRQPLENRIELLQHLYSTRDRRIEILAFCLMPNHFHLLIQQKQETGITRFVADFTNSNTKYFNTRHERNGPLYQGLFKAVHIETDEQLMHVSRYIHLNPIVAYLIPIEKLPVFPYTSYPEYLKDLTYPITNSHFILDMFRTRESHTSFIYNQVEYAKELTKIKHLLIDET